MRASGTETRVPSGAVAAGADVVEVGQSGDPAQVGEAAGMDDGGADEVDQLLLDQGAGVPDAVEHLAELLSVLGKVRFAGRVSGQAAIAGDLVQIATSLNAAIFRVVDAVVVRQLRTRLVG